MVEKVEDRCLFLNGMPVTLMHMPTMKICNVFLVRTSTYMKNELNTPWWRQTFSLPRTAIFINSVGFH